MDKCKLSVINGFIFINRSKYVHYYVRLYSVCRKVNSSVLAAKRRGTINNGSCNNDLLLLEAHYKFNGMT